MELKGKKILISGATGGIGSALIEKLSEHDASVFAQSKNGEKLEALKSKFSNIKGIVTLDFNNIDDLKRMYDVLPNDIDILVNAQGIGNYKSLGELTESDWDQSFNVNLKSVFLLSKYYSNLMASKEGSLIFNLGSRCGVTPIGLRSLYCATKFALRGFTLSLSEENKGKHPDYCLMTLGSTLTEFGPKTLEEKLDLQKKGKKYLEVGEVVDEIINILKDDNRKVEYVLNP